MEPRPALSQSPSALTLIDHFAVRERARHSLATSPRPFLRWAGSKRALLPQIVDVLPPSYGRYFEPFLGGGSLFFALRPASAVLADSCGELIDCYRAVRDDVGSVLAHLAPWVPDRQFFYQLRASRSSDPYMRAAEFIYLNKTCWNGLYRVNAAGGFNVPYGAPKSATVCDASNLRACARLLLRDSVDLAHGDFRATLALAQTGDLVFLDPPYVTGHNNNGFIDYNEKLFSWEDQVAAAAAARAAADRGATVIVTNAHHQDVIDLYDGFAVRTLGRSSTIAADSSRRARTQEAIFWRSPGLVAHG